MFTKEYWNTRAQQSGHTGYSDPFLYCFDQQARLWAINEIIKSLDHNKRAALDFGCGSGDFTELLSSCYKTVHGFDISETVVKLARKRFERKGIHISEDAGTLNGKTFDLILTVTVLQAHTPEELNETMTLLSGLLEYNGVFVAMEFFTTEEYNQKNTTKSVTTTDWQNALSKNNLKVVSEHNFYNPVTHPSASWKAYNGNIFLKILKFFKRFALPRKIFTARSRELISRYKDVLTKENSPFKIYVLKKQESLAN